MTDSSLILEKIAADASCRRARKRDVAMRPVDLFRRLRANLAMPDTPLPQEVRVWLSDALSDYDGTEALDVLLGLRGAGVRTIGTLERLHRRNVSLWVARTEFSHAGDPCATQAQCDGNFIEAVAKFRRKWSRIKHHNHPPKNLTMLEKSLFRVFQHGEPPNNPRSLLRASSI